MRVLRILVFLILIIVLSLGAGMMVLQKRYLPLIKPELEARMSRALHAEVSIEDLALTFMPDPAIHLSGLLIAMPPHCEHVASVKNAYLRFSARALVSGRLSAERMIISEPSANIALRQGRLATGSGGPCSGISSPPPASSPAGEPKAPQPAGTAGTTDRLPGWLSLRIKLIELRKGVLNFSQDALKLNLDGIDGRAAVAFGGGDAEIKDLVIRARLLGKPLSVETPLFRWNSSTGITGGPVSLGLGKNKLVLEGSFDPALGLKNIKASSNGLNLATLQGIVPGKILRGGGIVAFNLALQKEDAGDLRLSGDLHLEKFQWGDNPEIRLERGGVRGVDVLLRGYRPIRIKGTSSFEEFGLTYGKELYGLKSFEGTLAFDGARAVQNVQGDAQVKGFSFSDGLTSVFDVNAAVTKIRAQLDKAKGVQVSLALNGTSVRLTHPSVTILGAEKVEAPLTITVPKEGGYSVAGPVTVQSANLVIWERPLSKVSGHVDMLVSSPLKRFASQDLSGVHEQIAIAAGTTFSMTKEAYALSPTKLRLNNGSIEAEGEMKRSPETGFQVSAQAGDLAIQDMLRIASPASMETFDGTLTEFSGNISGDRSDFKRTAKGSGSLHMEQPLVRGFDLGRSLASALSRVPVLSGKIIPEKLKDDPKQISSRAKFQVGEGKVSFSDVKLRRQSYSVEGAVDIDFDMNLDGQAEVIFLEQTLKDLGGGYELLAKVMRHTAMVSFPILITGKIPDIDIKPNLTEFAKRASGLSLAESAIGGAIGLGRKGVDIITSPFRTDGSSSSGSSSSRP